MKKICVRTAISEPLLIG